MFIMRMGLFLILAWSFEAATVLAEEFQPQFERVTMEVGGKSFVTKSVRRPWGPTFQAGDTRIVAHDSVVESAEQKDGKALWKAPSEDGRGLQWLGAAGGVGLFAVRPLPQPADEAPEVRRLDLTTRKWLKPLLLPVEKKDPKQQDVVLGAAIHEDRVAVLTRQLVPGKDERGWAPTGSRLMLFRAGEEKPAWSQAFSSANERPEPGVRLWATTMPDYAHAAIQHVSWVGNRILVCAGEKDPLICVDAATGKTEWRVTRIWEYQRGFIGPSVWSHYIARFGVEHGDEDLFRPGTPEYDKAVEESAKALAPKRAEFDKQFQCALVGGPLVLPVAKDAAKGDADPIRRIYVAIAKGPNAWNWGYLSECVVYELTSGGTVIGVAQLPRIVNGHQFALSPDGVVWGCQKGALVRVVTQENARGDFGMGPGGPDLVCTVDWYRQFAAPPLRGWLVTEKVRDVVAFGQGYAFRAVAGGYVTAEADKVYRFPLSIVDLKSGVETQATVVVPYKGDLPLPTTNFSKGNNQMRTRGPYLLGVTQLQPDDKTLEIVLGMEGTSAGVSFDIKPMTER